ncbi:MAG: hypothetical protein FWD47_12345 [Treponema sp.]|nr:hypothetical protein [Treponema sp.]
MKNRPPIQWEPIDSENQNDEEFSRHFVECEFYKDMITRKKSIITGEKGSGKSAFRRNLVTKHKKENDLVIQIAFDDIVFMSIIDDVNLLLRSNLSGRLSQFAKYWESVIKIYAMQVAINSEMPDSSPNENRDTVYKYLQKIGILNVNDSETLMERIIEAARTLLDNSVSRSHCETTKHPLPNNNFISVEKKFQDYLKYLKKKIIITFDKFDTLETSVSSAQENLQLVFDALITAVYKITISEIYRDYIRIYCFIPHDRFVSNGLKDADKIAGVQVGIIWKRESIADILNKRIFSSIEKNFDETWNNLFPAMIKNERYNIQENSLDYILRHTLYRPRQVLAILVELEKEARTKELNDATFRKIVHDKTMDNVDFFIKEYAINYPYLDDFLKRFRNVQNKISYQDFRSHITKIFNDLSRVVVVTSIEDWLDQLYNIGFWGILYPLDDDAAVEAEQKYIVSNSRYNRKRYICKFYYHFPSKSITKSIHDDEEIVIHPMFYDYCNQACTDVFVT